MKKSCRFFLLLGICSVCLFWNQAQLQAQFIPRHTFLGMGKGSDIRTQMLSNQQGYVMLYQDMDYLNVQLYFTDDGGLSWVPRVGRGLLPPGNLNRVNGMHFFDSQQGLLLQKDGVMKTVNGGDDWELVQDTPSGAQNMCFYGDTGYVVASAGLYFKTTNRGESWISRTWNAAGLGILNCVCDREEVVMMGMPDPSVMRTPYARLRHDSIGIINYTVDFYDLVANNRGFRQDFNAFDSRTWYIRHPGLLKYTRDGGVTYKTVEMTAPVVAPNYHGMYWHDTLTGFGIFQETSYITYNGGYNWQLLQPFSNLTGKPLQLFASPDGNTLYLAYVKTNMPAFQLDSIELITIDGLALSAAPVAETSLILYPNPATDAIYLSGLEEGEQVTVNILDMQGQLVEKADIVAGQPVSVRKLPAGLFFYRAVARQRSFSGRFLKQ